MKKIVKKLTLMLTSFIFICTLPAMELQQMSIPTQSVALPIYNVTDNITPDVSNSILEYPGGTGNTSQTMENMIHISTQKIARPQSNLETFKIELLPKLQKEYQFKGYNIEVPQSFDIPMHLLIETLEKNGMDFEKEIELLEEEINENEIGDLENLENFIDAIETFGKKIVAILIQEEQNQTSITKYLSLQYWFDNGKTATLTQTVKNIANDISGHWSRSFKANLEKHHDEKSTESFDILMYHKQSTRTKEIYATLAQLFEAFFSKQAILDRLKKYPAYHMLENIMPDNITITQYFSGERYFYKTHMITLYRGHRINHFTEKFIQKIMAKLNSLYNSPPFLEFTLNQIENTIYVSAIENNLLTYINKHSYAAEQNVLRPILDNLQLFNSNELEQLKDNFLNVHNTKLSHMFYTKLENTIQNAKKETMLKNKSKKDFDLCLPMKKNNTYRRCYHFGKEHKTTICLFDENNIKIDCLQYNPTIGNPGCKSKDCWISYKKKVVCSKNCPVSEENYMDNKAKLCKNKPNNPHNILANKITQEKNMITQKHKGKNRLVRINKKKHPYIHAFFEQEAKNYGLKNPNVYIAFFINDVPSQSEASYTTSTKQIVILESVFNNIDYLKHISGHEFQHAKQDLLQKGHANEVEANIAGAINFISKNTDCELVSNKYNDYKTNQYLDSNTRDNSKHEIDAPFGHKSPHYENYARLITQAKDPVAVAYLEKVAEKHKQNRNGN